MKLMKYSFEITRYEYLESGNTQGPGVPKRYDWAHKGILSKVLPRVITQTKNSTTGGILRYLDKIFVFFLRYVRDLQHAKDPLYRDSIH